ncbi:MAG: sterol carrier family protein [Nakamurella sp.]
MPRRLVTDDDLRAAMAVAASADPDPAQIPEAVRTTARAIAQQNPGKTVEIRIPPYIAVQAFDGLRHTRGTPPNTIEMSADTWLGLVSGRLVWSAEVAAGTVRASGTRANISQVLPLQVE